MSLGDTFRKIMAAHPLPHTPPPVDPSSATWQGPFGGPGVPLYPMYADSRARRYDYQFGVNINVVPRSEYQGFIPTFDQLRTFYGMSSILKASVTFRTQQILSNSWDVTPRDGAATTGRGALRAKKLLEKPDPTMGFNFESWLGAALEAAWVHDALTIVPVRNVLRNVVALQIIDGTTIKPLIDYDTGGTPAPPDPAYLQIIKGSPYVEYTSDQMIYKQFRPRDWCIYGQSRVEKILESIMVYQLYESWTGDFFTQGNIPEVAALTDKEQVDLTNAKQFRKWQRIMDLIRGKNVSRRRVHLMPPFVKSLENLKEFTFSRELPDWFVRPLCIEFGVPAFMFVSETNRATAGAINEALYDSAIRMELLSTKRLIDDLLSAAGMPEEEFNWQRTPDYSKARVEGVVALCTPFDDGQRIMSVNEGREYLDLPEEEGQVEEGGSNVAIDTTAQVTQPASASAPRPVALPGSRTEQRQLQAAGKATGGVSDAPRPAARRFAGPGQRARRRIAMEGMPIIAKRLRQRQAEIVKQGLEMARQRQIKVVNKGE